MAARAIFVLLSLLLSACASTSIDFSREAPYFAIYQKRPEREVPPELVKQLDAAPVCCASLATLPYQDLPAFGEISVRIDAHSPAFAFDGGKSFFAAWRIGRLPRPFRIEIASRLAAQSASPLTLPAFRELVFAPDVLVLDARFRVLRRLSAGIARGGCEQFFYADIFSHRIDIMAPALASAEYLVVMTSDAQRARDGEDICGALRHGLSPVGEIVLQATGLDFDDGTPLLETAAMWYPGKRGYRDVGLFEGMMRDPGTLMFGDVALHYLEPVGHRLQRRLRIPYDAIVSMRRSGPGIDEPPVVDRSKVAIDAQGFVPGTARYLGVAFIEAGQTGIEEHTFDLAVLDAGKAGASAYDAAVAVLARREAAIPPDRYIETVALGVRADTVTVSFEPADSGSLGRIGNSAMMGGVIVASPCGLCQTGACTPEMLVTCAALFSVGAVAGGVVGTGQELYERFASPVPRPEVPEAARQRIAPAVQAGGAAHFDSARLLGCIADRVRVPDDEPWREQGRRARIELIPEPATDAADDAARIAGLKAGGRAYAGMARVARISLVAGKPAEPGRSAEAHLRVEGEITVSDVARGKSVTSHLEWGGTPHPLQEWADNGAIVAAAELQLACRTLADDVVDATRKVWRGR